MFCKESATDYLRQLGYCVVRVPKSDISPLLLLSRSGRSLDRFGQLDTVLVNDGAVALPAVQRDLPAANITGRTSSALKLGIGLSVLSDVLAAMGGSPLGLDLAYSKANRISFEFRDVVEDRVEVAALDRYLSSADLNTHTTNAARLLESDDLYVVTSTLKCDRIVVRAWDSQQSSVDIDVPMLQEILGGRIGVTAAGDAEQQITYAGSTRLVFAFQAFRMRYTNGTYRALASASKVTMRGDTSDDDLLHVEAPFIRIGG